MWLLGFPFLQTAESLLECRMVACSVNTTGQLH